MLGSEMLSHALDGTLTEEAFAALDAADRIELLQALVELQDRVSAALRLYRWTPPGSAPDDDRRRNNRRNVAIRASLVLPAKAVQYESTIRDLSGMGARVWTRAPLRSRQMLVLSFILGGQRHEIWASVRWVTGLVGGIVEAGLEFQHLSEHAAKYIMAHLQDMELDPSAAAEAIPGPQPPPMGART